jgi:hypothetical protein
MPAPPTNDSNGLKISMSSISSHCARPLGEFWARGRVKSLGMMIMPSCVKYMRTWGFDSFAASSKLIKPGDPALASSQTVQISQ